MFRLLFKKKLYSYERVIFPNMKVGSNADIVRYMRYKDKMMLGYEEKECYYTPITDLSLSYDEISMQYDKKLRNQVKRAYKENIALSIFDSIDPNKDEVFLKDIMNKYYLFCESLNLSEMKNNFIWDEFVEFVRLGNVIISKAEYENGWVFHIYQCDGTNAMLWFSFSDYRQQEGNTQLPGWANRALHDTDIRYFKEKGYIEYDWGNISSLDAPNNIDKFKMSFGGKIVPVYCSFVGNTVKGKMLIKLRELKHKNEKQK